MLDFPEHLRPIPKPTVTKSDQDYYNDLPGKFPPDLVVKTEKSPTVERRRERLSSNLIDLDTPPIDHNYVNQINDDFEMATSMLEKFSISKLPFQISFFRFHRIFKQRNLVSWNHFETLRRKFAQNRWRFSRPRVAEH